MSSQRSTIRPVGITVFLAVCLALPAWVWAAPPSSNPGQPFAEMGAQHNMIKQDIADAETAIQADIAEVKALLEAQDAPLCGAGTEGERFVSDTTEVCDNTTGLYWQQSPSTSVFDWTEAIAHCTALGSGYALPEVKQLISLVDYSEPNPADALNDPNGPFEDVQSGSYWSATPDATFPADAWFVFFGNGFVLSGVMGDRAWCVRGDQNGS